MDEMERELRRLLRDDRLRVEPPPDALDRVHRGAARRQRRRRAAAGGLGAMSVVAVVAVALGLPLAQQQRGEDTAASAASASAESAKRATTGAAPTPAASDRQSAPPSPSKLQKVPPGGPVPDGFAAASVTAMSPSSFWVLGTAPCDNPTCTSLVHTTDGGRTFTGLPAPKAPLAEGRGGGRTVRDLRFASADDGYAFGGALWSTHDGGQSWAEQDIPGRVVRLESERDTAWAVVERGDSFRLYRSPTSRDSWDQVSLPVQLDAVTPDLALQSGAVTLVGTSGERAVTVVSEDGRSFEADDRPCAPALDSRLSAFGDTVWMFCATGNQGMPYVSATSGRTWDAVDAAPPGGWSNSTVVGARGAETAVFASGGQLYRVRTDGSIDRAESASPGGGNVRYVGFTTRKVGYALLDRPTPAALLRTTDGGRSWSVVRYS